MKYHLFDYLEIVLSNLESVVLLHFIWLVFHCVLFQDAGFVDWSRPSDIGSPAGNFDGRRHVPGHVRAACGSRWTEWSGFAAGKYNCFFVEAREFVTGRPNRVGVWISARGFGCHLHCVSVSQVHFTSPFRILVTHIQIFTLFRYLETGKDEPSFIFIFKKMFFVQVHRITFLRQSKIFLLVYFNLFRQILKGKFPPPFCFWICFWCLRKWGFQLISWIFSQKPSLVFFRYDITPDGIPSWIVQEVDSPRREVSLSILSKNNSAENGNGEFENEVVIWLRKIADICSLGRDVVLAIMDNYCFAQFLQVPFNQSTNQSINQRIIQ